MDGDLSTAPAFRRVVRGYDPDAVDAWAASAAATVTRLRHDLAEARAQESARQQAPEGLANALGIVEASLGYTDGHGTAAPQVTTLSVVAS